MRHYLNVYKNFISTSTTLTMSFRTNFILVTVMDFLFYVSLFSTASFIFLHVKQIGGWSKEQLLFFISFILTVNNLSMTFISMNFWSLPEDIKSGQLDFILLRPIHSIFIVFFRQFRPSTLINTPIPWALMIYYGNKLQFDLINWLVLPFLVILSFILNTICEFIIATLIFWTKEGDGINFLRMQFGQMSRWPEYIYSDLPRKFFLTVIPFLLIASAPTYFLFDKSNFHLLALMGTMIFILSVILLKLWSIALLKYESASS